MLSLLLLAEQADAYLRGEAVMRQEGRIPFQGWKIASFSTYASVRERVNSVLALEIMAFAILLAVGFYFASRKAASRLVFSERESAELRQLNAALQREIAEREKRLVSAGIGSDALSWALWRTDAETRETWENWMIANLPPDSSGVSRLRARQTLDQPIQLRGVGFENEPLDTADWAGDVVIVDFWGEWCAPCRAIHSQLADFMRIHANRGLRVVGVLCSKDPEKAEEYLREQDTPWPQFVVHGLERPNEHPIAQRFGIDSFPTLWVIDRAGVLRHVGHRMDDEWVALLERLLDEPAPESIER